MAGAGRENRRESVRFVVLFLLVFGALYGTLTYWEPARDWVVAPWTNAVATVAASLLRLLDSAVQQSGNVIFGDAFAVNIIDGCNGVTPLALLVAAVLAFPTTGRARAIGLLIGVPGVALINLARILGLFLLGAHFPDWFDRSHLYVAQAFVILLTGGLWLWWLGRFAAPLEPATDA